MHVGSDFGLYVWGEEVALDSRNAARRLRGDYVDADDSAARSGAVDRDL